jgi:hypothetical protein
MSVHAGTILHVAGNNVIDRLQSAGLGDVQVPTEVIREVGNRLVVDKIPGDPDFTFSMESFDVTTELEAMLIGKRGATLNDPTAQPGAADAVGTVYDFTLAQFVNIVSPWKDSTAGAAGTVKWGHVIPGYFPTRIQYRYGVSDNASETVELAGGAFYYAPGAPVEQIETGDGTETDFATDDPAIPYRIGGSGGTTFKSVFGVIVNGILQTEGVDYTQLPNNSASAAVATVTFATAPANGAVITFCYFTTATRAFPQAVHPTAINKPGAIRGRNICVYLGTGGARQKVAGVQSFELDATIDGTVDREFCNEEIVGRTINSFDVNGTLTVRPKDGDAFMAVLSKMTGVPLGEVVGFLNTNSIPLEVALMNPKNPAQTLKTLYVADAIFQPPGTPARVNAPTDFAIRWESQSGSYQAIKGARVP